MFPASNGLSVEQWSFYRLYSWKYSILFAYNLIVLMLRTFHIDLLKGKFFLKIINMEGDGLVPFTICGTGKIAICTEAWNHCSEGWERTCSPCRTLLSPTYSETWSKQSRAFTPYSAGSAGEIQTLVPVVLLQAATL